MGIHSYVLHNLCQNRYKQLQNLLGLALISGKKELKPKWEVNVCIVPSRGQTWIVHHFPLVILVYHYETYFKSRTKFLMNNKLFYR